MSRRRPIRINSTTHKHDRLRAERAIGRQLQRHQHVHHFTLTQLVICENAAYHKLLHVLEASRGNFAELAKPLRIWS